MKHPSVVILGGICGVLRLNPWQSWFQASMHTQLFITGLIPTVSLAGLLQPLFYGPQNKNMGSFCLCGCCISRVTSPAIRSSVNLQVGPCWVGRGYVSIPGEETILYLSRQENLKLVWLPCFVLMKSLNLVFLHRWRTAALQEVTVGLMLRCHIGYGLSYTPMGLG